MFKKRKEKDINIFKLLLYLVWVVYMLSSNGLDVQVQLFISVIPSHTLNSVIIDSYADSNVV